LRAVLARDLLDRVSLFDLHEVALTDAFLKAYVVASHRVPLNVAWVPAADALTPPLCSDKHTAVLLYDVADTASRWTLFRGSPAGARSVRRRCRLRDVVGYHGRVPTPAGIVRAGFQPQTLGVAFGPPLFKTG